MTPARSRTAGEALRRHWPEYMMEAAELGLFMFSACLLGTLLEHPASPVRQAIADPFLRRVLMGLAMGATAIGIIYSPWGKRSGAHFNPGVTLTFLRLGKVQGWDAAFYGSAQFLGAVAGTLAAALPLGTLLADPAVNYVATLPGPRGAGVAFAAEMGIACLLMTVILHVSNRPRLNHFTGLFAGLLVATYITFEAPLSGMSMNPARTFGSAFAGQIWDSIWIYFVAPPLAMLLAAEVYLRVKGSRAVLCAKLHHNNSKRCIFRCGYMGWPARNGEPRGSPASNAAVGADAGRGAEEFGSATQLGRGRTRRRKTMSKTRMTVTLIVSLVTVGMMATPALVNAQDMHTSKAFSGPKATKGTVTHAKMNGKSMLTLSDDFVVPETPDPHWMLVDSKGATFLAQKLKIKDDGYNKSIEIPAYVRDVKKVIIWCAWAETNLGEAEFSQAVK